MRRNPYPIPHTPYPFRRWFTVFFFAAITVSIAFVALAPRSALASTNISSNVAQHWAWDDSIGWIDFYGTDNIVVSAAGLTGYASSSAGPISLDCATSPVGNICHTSNYQVLNDGHGNLSGWGWNDAYGWISFCGGSGTASCPGSISYSTHIKSDGTFWGYAWNDVIGWIDFNCNNIVGTCTVSNYEVLASWAPTSTTGYLDSATFDTGVASGAQLNSLMWQGSLPGGTAIGFQLAVSNSSSGPWNFMGPGGTSSTSYTVNPATPQPLDYSLFSGYRYFRYQAILTSDITESLTPQVNEIIINWSP